MIELKNINKTYQMGNVEVKALKNVSLKIAQGEFIAIMGPSGSGKSTLMHVLGLLDRPDSGSYTLGEKDLTIFSDEHLAVIRNHLVGFIFQQFHLLPRMTALENVELPLVYAGKRHLIERAKEELTLVGLKDRLNHSPNELSGGQQQRVAIARALVNDPLIILADEPTGNLDSKSKEEIISVLKDLNQQGKTVVIVTHEKEVAAHVKRIITVRDGEIILDKAGENAVLERLDKTLPATEAGGYKETLNKIREITALSSTNIGKTKFMDYLRQAVFAIISHKMRSILSILGILIGVAAVIAMLALGEGAKKSIQKQLASLGSNLLVLRPGSSRLHGIAMEGGGPALRLTPGDIQAIRKLSPLVMRVSPSVNGRGQLVYANKNWNTQVEGVGADYAELRASIPVIGRFFTPEEEKLREKVVILGTTVVSQLFGDAYPIGQTIKINLINFKVIGILPAKGASTFRDQDDTIIIPVTTAMNRLFGKENFDSIYIEASGSDVMDTAIESITSLIKKTHRLDKNDEDSFQIRNMSDIKNALESTTKTMSLLLGCIAAISLLVGGIGIMNIMLVSVTERTREIGLRKAIGANNNDIMTQFLIEAVLMSFLGGLGGVGLGTGVAVLITVLAKWSVEVSLFSIILATTFSLAVGLVFGLWPAKQASRLNPIEALRYE